ncbi:MAG: cobyrinate a,c-diamide synthase [Planctomycetaceae bacterium]|nr:cobyrinate a,c-diamide synthase [Planctomycetaceae bacterium]
MARTIPRLLITAPASGGGKTTVTLGLLQALLDRGLVPSSFKCGPDFIDPLFHREVVGVNGYNLDLFFTTPPVVRGLLARGSAGADIAVVEGVMGYYDGIGDNGDASSWAVAAATGTPAVMVVNARGASLSLAALVNGFRDFRPASMLAGVILNRCSQKYHDKIAPVLERETGLRVFGCLPDNPAFDLPSRHLGLVTPDGVDELRHKLAILGKTLAATVDLEGLLKLAASASPIQGEWPTIHPAVQERVRIAVARDRAFSFYYRENFEVLEESGAELAFFSPLGDERIPDDAAGLYFGGGYPELFSAELAANTGMRESVAAAVQSGMPTLAECGGFLYLQESLTDKDGKTHAMAGALPGRGSYAGGLRRFGYIGVTQTADTLLGPKGTSIKGHEFHYWDSSECGSACVAEKPTGGGWNCVQAPGNVFAGFPHLYFLSNPECAASFVQAAARWRERNR